MIDEREAMVTTTINLRIDQEVKSDMEAVCKELGMNMTTAFTIFAKKMGREGRIPFSFDRSFFIARKILRTYAAP